MQKEPEKKFCFLQPKNQTIFECWFNTLFILDCRKLIDGFIYLTIIKIGLSILTFSCLKKHNIFNSLKTLFEDTNDWNTFGNFFNATRLPSRGSVTALKKKIENFNFQIQLFFKYKN